MKAEVDSLKRFSFLIAATDPYIVLPGIFARGKNVGKVGDYAVIVYGDQIYPAIVGDVGPGEKVGEASLRIAQEINAQSTPYSRPVSDLRVTYLIFPGTAETPFGPPDLEKIRARCEKLVQELGGASVPLYHWKDIVPTPTPTPSPTPIPTPSPTSTSAPSPISSSGASSSPNESAAVSPTPIVSPTFAFPTPAESLSPATSSNPTASPIVTPTPKG
jgi:hypothetical protein